jgi:uncharacterized protein
VAVIENCEIEVAGEHLHLLPERAIYWPKKNALILCDLHFGKSGHFRKAGIPVPQKIHEDDLMRLEKIIKFHAPECVFLLGDLFHSRKNKEWDFFSEWRNKFPATLFHLIKGNHDRWVNDFSLNHDLTIHDSFLHIDPFCFVHDFNLKKTDCYIFSGHVHPAVYLSGRGKQSASFPCFYFGKEIAILPSFGNFTGQCLITPSRDDRVYVIIKNEVKALSAGGGFNSGSEAPEN